jgi:hypothetical protein
MATNIRYRSADGASFISGNVEDEGQIVSNPSAIVYGDPVKVCVENFSDRSLGNVGDFIALVLKRTQVGSNDGWTMVLTADDPNGTISKPWGDGVDDFDVPTGAPVAALTGPYGSWGALGTYGAVVTAVNGTGETIASVEVTFNVGAATDQWTVTWAAVPGATSYNYYRTDADDAGTYGAYSLVASGITGTSYDDVGDAPVAGTPPADNTTGGAGPDYGTPPADVDFDTADLTIATAPEGLAVGQQWFFYFIVKVPINKRATGNKRLMQLFPTEV